MWSLQEDEYQTYDDQPLDELGVQQEAPEVEEVVGGDEQQEGDNDTTVQDSQNFETEMVLRYFKSSTLWLSFNLQILDQRMSEMKDRVPVFL